MPRRKRRWEWLSLGLFCAEGTELALAMKTVVVVGFAPRAAEGEFVGVMSAWPRLVITINLETG